MQFCITIITSSQSDLSWLWSSCGSNRRARLVFMELLQKKKVNRTLLKDSLMHGRTSSKCAEKNRQYTASALSKLILFFITNTFFNVFHQRVIGIEITLMGNKESNCS